MQRQLKFRYWYSGKMLEVGQIEFFVDGQIHVNEELVGGVLMQATGLKDKNGRDIFEGDIMSDPLPNGNPWTAEVRWSDVEACYFPIGMGKYEVIGNIYENPDLLAKYN